MGTFKLIFWDIKKSHVKEKKLLFSLWSPYPDFCNARISRSGEVWKTRSYSMVLHKYKVLIAITRFLHFLCSERPCWRCCHCIGASHFNRQPDRHKDAWTDDVYNKNETGKVHSLEYSDMPKAFSCNITHVFVALTWSKVIVASYAILAQMSSQVMQVDYA